MTAQPLFVDTAVFAYALGGAHPLREACRSLVADAGRGRVELHASVEMIQELVFHRMRRGDRKTAIRQGRDTAVICVLHDFDTGVLRQSLDLLAGCRDLGGRDAVHAATALHNGITTIVSTDRVFDRVPGLTRVAPDAVGI